MCSGYSYHQQAGTLLRSNKKQLVATPPGGSASVSALAESTENCATTPPHSGSYLN